ncbi:Mediator of RNA polymerase II transcription subunit 31 [Hanseniaspora osmophila]|uniref:Mediator of RNA polymerase II transcription subunit 31 n=1 Tax=Hanseniaspora osmophila TaxID=56408 RepID=A0A1E5RDX0_9ASCO|nr:Mediator of RNA polymerase II transcription subunit 31 [Hanseniaspora osmophila]
MDTIDNKNEQQDITNNDDQPTRFEIELEFIQSLSNISYLQYLFITLQLHKDVRFLEYLKYLYIDWVHNENTIKRIKYIKNIIYPNSLHILSILYSFVINNKAMEIPTFVTTQGPALMNEMVQRWEN